MGSISGRMTTPLLAPYAASKAAVEAISDALRIELQPWRIHVAVIEPGAVATPIWDKGRAAGAALKGALPAGARELYGAAIEAVERAAGRAARHAMPTGAVVRAVAHALTAPRPKTRYLVGRDARVQALVARLPDRLRDRLLTRAMRLPAPGSAGAPGLPPER
jgi:short-subunit dehydrogenase